MKNKNFCLQYVMKVFRSTVLNFTVDVLSAVFSLHNTALISLLLTLLVFSSSYLALAEEPVNVYVLADSIRQAEGVWTYGVKSVKCETEEACRKICINSIRNNLKRYQRSDKSKDFITFMGFRWCPPSIHKLNRNWVKNTTSIYNKRINKLKGVLYEGQSGNNGRTVVGL